MTNIPLQAKDRIILPLDTPSLKTARPLIAQLKAHVGLFKIGLTLFIKEGLQVIRQVQDLSGGCGIFLDLKLHDTPMQVGRAAAILQAETPGIQFLTVHCAGGVRMVKSVVDAMSGETQILGVTALTSLKEEEFARADDKATTNERVLAMAEIAKEGCAGGVVSSGHEASDLKAHFRDTLLIITPGIRPAWSQVNHDDQRRTMPPGEAIKKGADYLVIGRPIYGSSDPVGAAEKIAEEIADVSSQR